MDAGITAMTSGETHYTMTTGTTELRRAIAKKLKGLELTSSIPVAGDDKMFSIGSVDWLLSDLRSRIASKRCFAFR